MHAGSQWAKTSLQRTNCRNKKFDSDLRLQSKISQTAESGGREVLWCCFSHTVVTQPPLPAALSLSKHSQVRHHGQPPACPCHSPEHCVAWGGHVRFINSKRHNGQHWGVSLRAAGASLQMDKCCALFIFCSKGVLQSPGYVKNLQNVSGRRGFKGENVNPLFRYNTIIASGLLLKPEKMELFEEQTWSWRCNAR